MYTDNWEYSKKGIGMTLGEAKKLLHENNIEFEAIEFVNEEAYWNHVILFPYTKNAKPFPVIALVIYSNNHHKNIELQFNFSNDDYIFEEMFFGGFSFEMFDVDEDMLHHNLINRITEIMFENAKCIEKWDLKKAKWCGDAMFDNSDDNTFEHPGFQNAICHIKKKKSIWAFLFKSQILYEIFDWDNYRKIIK